MGKSNYLSNELLDHVLGGADYARPGTVYVLLYTTMPTGAGGGTEVTGGAYARVSKVNNIANFPAASGQVKHNGTAIDFGTATGADWGTVLGAGVNDADPGGNNLIFGTFTVSRTIRDGDSFSIGVNGMSWSES